METLFKDSIGTQTGIGDEVLTPSGKPGTVTWIGKENISISVQGKTVTVPVALRYRITKKN